MKWYSLKTIYLAFSMARTGINDSLKRVAPVSAGLWGSVALQGS